MAGNETIGNVVREFYIGNTLVKICDDYCRERAPREIEKILQRIARQALAGLSASTAANDYGKIKAT